MDQALQERLDRIEQRMDTFEETLEQGKRNSYKPQRTICTAFQKTQ